MSNFFCGLTTHPSITIELKKLFEKAKKKKEEIEEEIDIKIKKKYLD